MTVEGIESSAGSGFAFAEPSTAATTSRSSRPVSRGQAFGTDRDFLSSDLEAYDRKGQGQGQNKPGDNVFDLWIGMLSVAFNVSMLAIILGSALSAAPLASYHASGGYVFPLEAPVPANYGIAASCRSDRRPSCGG
jgi:hypothetical protein